MCDRLRNGWTVAFAFGPLVTVFTGAGSGGVCGGLTGHVKADHEGRGYLARSYCGKPVVAVT